MLKDGQVIQKIEVESHIPAIRVYYEICCKIVKVSWCHTDFVLCFLFSFATNGIKSSADTSSVAKWKATKLLPSVDSIREMNIRQLLLLLFYSKVLS